MGLSSTLERAVLRGRSGGLPSAGAVGRTPASRSPEWARLTSEPPRRCPALRGKHVGAQGPGFPQARRTGACLPPGFRSPSYLHPEGQGPLGKRYFSSQVFLHKGDARWLDLPQASPSFCSLPPCRPPLPPPWAPLSLFPCDRAQTRVRLKGHCPRVPGRAAFPWVRGFLASSTQWTRTLRPLSP